jgi:hypothetical protein
MKRARRLVEWGFRADERRARRDDSQSLPADSGTEGRQRVGMLRMESDPNSVLPSTCIRRITYRRVGAATLRGGQDFDTNTIGPRP